MIERLLTESADRVVLMDGGMGSSIEDRGVNVRNALWGSSALLTVQGRSVNDRLHEEFVAAGAEILIANTHNASLDACGDEERLREVNGLAMESARRAAATGARVAVAAGIGSAEGPYAERAALTPEDVSKKLAPQARILAELGTDLLLFETLTTDSEIEGVAMLTGTLDLPPFGIGLTCGDDGRTLGGVSMGEAVATLLPAGPVAFFVQCTAHDIIDPALSALAAGVGGRAVIGVYANDGRKWIDMRWHGERIAPEDYAADALGWRDAGARVIGGCCGTGPEHVAALREAFRT